MVATSNLNDPQFDGVVVVTDKIGKLSGKLESLKSALQDYSKVIYDIINDLMYTLDTSCHLYFTACYLPWEKLKFTN